MNPPRTQNTFTPKQVALALGVSESSVKRWCDSGRLQAGRTAGGHRKLSMAAVVELVRETGQELANPEALGMVAISTRRRPDQVVDELYEALLAGDEAACRNLVLGLYQQGASIVELGDNLLGGVFRRIGDDWKAGKVTVHEERRACEVAMTVLHELRRWIPEPPESPSSPDGAVHAEDAEHAEDAVHAEDRARSEPAAQADAPLALTATPERDFADVPIRLVELVLLSAGWRTIMAGSGLPLGEIVAAIKLRRPQLVCLSVTHLENAPEFIDRHNRLLIDGAYQVPVIIGGSAFDHDQAAELRCELFATRLADLDLWLKQHQLGGSKT